MKTNEIKTPSDRNPSTSTALILGFTGGYGRTMADALLRAGYRVRAQVRDLEKGRAIAASLSGEVELVQGDVLDPAALGEAAAGAEVIVHGVNAPYHQWNPLILRYARAIAEVAAENQATILFPGNVYAYAPGEAIDETTAPNPPTEKGTLRLQVQDILAQAVGRGARLIVLRGGDFFGLGHDSAWMTQVLGRAAKGGPITLPGSPELRHQWAYLPDFCRAQVRLLALGDTLPADARFHFEGHIVTGNGLVAAAREALGDSDRRTTRLPWWLLRVAGVFVPLLGALVPMRYLWDSEVIMRGAKLATTLGEVHQTPLSDALRLELQALRAATGSPSRPQPSRVAEAARAG